MKELLAAFGVEIFRPVVTLLVPGAYGIAPILFYIFFRYPRAWQFVTEHKDSNALIFVAVATAFGLILEDAGSELEERLFNRMKEVSKEDWYRYLRLAFETEPIGHRYLRSIVLRLKFELAMSLAGLPAAIATLGLPISWQLKSVLVAAITCLSVFLLWQAIQSIGLTDTIRRELLKGQVVWATTSRAVGKTVGAPDA